MFDSFYDKISEIVDLHVPVIQLSKKEMKTKSKPWITPAIQISISKKNKLYKNYLKTKSVHYYTRFKIYRNKINNLLRISKRNYYNSYFAIKQGNSKLIWEGIKSIINVKSKVPGTPVINENDSEISDPKKIADAFNRYFSNVGETLDNKIPKVNKSPHEYMTSSPCDSLFLYPTSLLEIEDEIAKLNCSKATGPFSIPVKFFKAIKKAVSGPLEIIFNASLLTGIVPRKLKVTKVYSSI